MNQYRTLDNPTAREPTIPGDRFTPTREETAALAYEFWLERHSPIGSPDEDWLRAERELEHSRTSGSVL